MSAPTEQMKKSISPNTDSWCIRDFITRSAI